MSKSLTGIRVHHNPRTQPMPSIYDLFELPTWRKCRTKRAAYRAAETSLDNILKAHPEFKSQIEYLKINGDGCIEPVAAISTLVELLMLCPGPRMMRPTVVLPPPVSALQRKTVPSAKSDPFGFLHWLFMNQRPMRRFRIRSHSIELYLMKPRIAIELNEHKQPDLHGYRFVLLDRQQIGRTINNVCKRISEIAEYTS